MTTTLGHAEPIDALGPFLIRALEIGAVIAVVALIVMWLAYRTGPKP
jgi:hypothetical protein